MARLKEATRPAGSEGNNECGGGRKILGRIIATSDDLAQLVGKGLPARSVSALAEMGNAVLSRKLGIPQPTMTRRLSHHSRLTPTESDKMVRLTRVIADAAREA